MMMMSSSVFHHHHHHHAIGIAPPIPNYFSTNWKHKHFIFSNSKISMPHFLCQAASITGSSPSDYSPPEKKKSVVAGIEQDELVDPTDLADPDSCFLEFKGVHIHHKIYVDEEHHHDQTTKLGIILLHGFGASLFSWDPAMKPLARATGSKVVAFDRPAFGLTSRHSAGSLVAVNTYFEAPKRVAALVLIAPAIFAPLTSPKVMKKNQNQSEGTDPATSNAFTVTANILSKFSIYVARAIVRMLKGMVNMVSSLFRKALTAFLRSTFAAMLVRMVIDQFGIAAIRNAWYDASQITDHVLQGYTKPLRTKDWDRALLEFTVAMLTDSASKSEPPFSKRLNEISCPVLIITGDSDRLVPSWNAEKLSRAIPGSCLEIIKNCGHLPHEEKVEEFVSITQKFLQRVLGAPEDQLLQVAS